MRLKLDVENSQVNAMDVYGKYDSIEDFISFSIRCKGVETVIPSYVVVIGQSLNKVDWDILIDYFNDKNKYKKVIICYYNSCDHQLFNLYQMLKNGAVDYKVIEERIKTGYYVFVKYNDLQDLLKDLNKNIEQLSIHKYDDLDEREEKVLQLIVKNQQSLLNKGVFRATEDIDEEDMSDILESLNKKGYIEIKEGHRKVGGSDRPYIVTKILKY